MNILIAYATYSSGTQSASNYVKDLLSKNHKVTIKNITTVNPNDFNNFDLTILASPSWWVQEMDGMPHIHFVEFFDKTNNVSYESKNFAIFGLGDEKYTHFCGAVDHLEKFVVTHKGNLKTPSLRIDGFYFDEEKNKTLLEEWVKKIVE